MIKGIFKKNVSFLVCRKEYDSPENNELLNWLERENWEIKEKSWNLVGSQEITTYQISKNNVKAKLVLSLIHISEPTRPY